MGKRSTTSELLTARALNRATLERQSLLVRSGMSVTAMLERLCGLQAQTPQTWYTALWSRLAGFRAEALSDLLRDRAVVRMALMRSTIHLVTARDAWGFRPLVQPALDRMQGGQFGRRLEGLDVDDVVAMGRAFVEVEPRSFRALGDHLLTRWPERDRMALEQAVRTGVPLVQVPPRGLWRRSGPVAHTSMEAWLGAPPREAMTLHDLVRRYLAGFGPASVMDAQAWCGLTKLGEVFDGLRPGLRTFHDERGRELFDLPESPRPDPGTPAPPRFLYDYENLLLSYADRSRTLIAERVERIVVRSNESISTFLVDGFVAGTWRLERSPGAATLVIVPVIRLSTSERSALTDEGAALLRFAASDAATHDIRVLPMRLD